MANFNITIPANRKSVVTDAEMIGKGFSHKFSVLSSDIVAAGAVGATDTVTVICGNTPAWWAVDKALAVINTAFGPTGALSVAVGTGSTIGAFVPAGSTLTAGVLPMAAALPVLTNANGTTAASIQILLTNSVSGSIATLTAGDLDVYINLINTQKGAGGLS